MNYEFRGTIELRRGLKYFLFPYFYFVCKAGNGETIATSETYTRKGSAKDTINSYFPEFKVIDKTLS